MSTLLGSQGGGYLLQLMDTYSCGWGIFVIALSETVAIFWIYGWKNFLDVIYNFCAVYGRRML